MPSSIVVNVFLLNLVKILRELSSNLIVIGGGFSEDLAQIENSMFLDVKMKLHERSAVRSVVLSVALQTFKILLIQLTMSFFMLKYSRRFDKVLFLVGGPNLFLPVLVTKLIRKEAVVIAIGTGFDYRKSVEARGSFWKAMYFRNANFVEEAIFKLSSKIIVDVNVESENLIQRFELEPFRNKVRFGGALPINLEQFYITVKHSERERRILYVGRLSEEKGVLNLVKAMPMIMDEIHDVRLTIAGDGQLREELVDEAKKNGSIDRIDFLGWVRREDIREIFNKAALLVVPSYTETVPTVIIEAGACGTPVVASPVGAIPDFIVDGMNGFLMKSNSPECIASSISRAISCKKLEEVSRNAREKVLAEYNFPSTIRNYERILK